jgi:shikimate dehydrogenase
MKNLKSTISGTTKVAGIFGFPVSHSFSPAMHNAAYRALKINAVYVPFEVKPDELAAAVKSIRALGIIGVNVTVPHKEHIIPFLDRIDPLARQIGSVNTVVNIKGALVGYNTDAEGFLKDIRSYGFNPKGKTACIIGAGGAGKAVAAALSQEGAAKIFIYDMNVTLAKKTAKRVPRARLVEQKDIKILLPKTDILINATPCGLHAGDTLPIDANLLHRGLFVYDLVYHRTTDLVRAARLRGVRAANGLGMLLNQGTRAFELMTSHAAPISCMRKELEKILSKKVR